MAQTVHLTVINRDQFRKFSIPINCNHQNISDLDSDSDSAFIFIIFRYLSEIFDMFKIDKIKQNIL